jgi:DNA repair exonuclease SbcCD ATPase subunit
MIIFKKLKYCNFLGAGNSPIEIILNKNRTTLVIGTNGSGKSSGLLDGLTFALFGKPFRSIKKAQLINTINLKKCLVEVEFSIGTKEYIVKRGIKPDVFEIWIDGKLMDQVADVREHQRMLEEQILHMNFRTFNQVVLLSVSNFKPFMQLDTSDRRAVIEDILDIGVFSDMNDALKKRISVLKETTKTIDGNIEVQKQKVELQKKYVETLSLDHVVKQNELINAIDVATKQIDELESKIIPHTTAIEEFSDMISDESVVSAKWTKLYPFTVPLQGKLDALKETIEFYSENEHCPTCTQPINPEFKDDQISTTQTKLIEATNAIEKLQSQLDSIKQRELEIAEIKKKINLESVAIQTINNQIISEQTYIKRLNTELNNISKSTGNIDQERDKIKDLAAAAMNLVRQKSELSEKKQYYDIATTLLKDSGIKTKIIDQYVPVMNKLINKYLGAMDTWISFNLDSEFNETIKSRHRDTFSYASFSEGEKQRIDLAILFTWRTIAKMKNSVSCNLLVFDEILDKCLDGNGTDQVVSLLDTLGEGTNVFVISHKVAELQDKFHSTLKFEKVNNFSQLAV